MPSKNAVFYETPTPKDETIGSHEPIANLNESAFFYGKDVAHYPESDGKPMADSTGQFRWIQFLSGNLSYLFKDDTNVLVASDLLWYPVRGRPDIVTAPDVMIIWGRPKHDRRSYKQFEEEGIAPQVVFEVLSHSNTKEETEFKTAFYRERGVREFYLYDHENCSFEVVLFANGVTQSIPVANEWTGPLLGIRFMPQLRADMEVYYPDGTPFLSFIELAERMRFEVEQGARARERAIRERERAEQEAKRANAEARRADTAETEIARLRALLGGAANGNT